MLLPMFDDPLSQRLANLGYLRKLGPRGNIHVDLKRDRANWQPLDFDHASLPTPLPPPIDEHQ